MTLYFYSVRNDYGCFSNFSAHGFVLEDLWWPTSEHYFQAQKFVGTPHAEAVQLAKTPKQAAEMGRDRKRPLRPDWEAVKDGVMYAAVLRKFETHGDIRAILLSTGTEELVESTTHDYYWGCGTDGTGRNQLGKTLMLVRQHFQALQSPAR